jgi:hypothetical protein
MSTVVVVTAVFVLATFTTPPAPLNLEPDIRLAGYIARLDQAPVMDVITHGQPESSCISFRTGDSCRAHSAFEKPSRGASSIKPVLSSPASYATGPAAALS